MKPVALQLIDSFHQGGSERQALQLTRLLSDSGRFDVRLASLSPEGVLRSEADALTIGEVPSYPLTSFCDANAALQLKRFVRFLRKSKVDILHSHDFYTNVFGMFAATLARVPVRIASRRETGGMRSRAQQHAQSFAYKTAHGIVANSNAVRAQLISEGVPNGKIRVIYNGLNIERVASDAQLSRQAAIAELGLPSSLATKPTVSIVANMRLDVKDYPMFLRMARRVSDQLPAAFLLAGEGELMPNIRRDAADLGLKDSVFFLGGCDLLAQLFAASDVCVLTSKTEGFSNSILEYMAAARPVVATNVGGAGEAIVSGETGYLVESGDDTAMANRVLELLRDPDRARQMGRSGHGVVMEKFSLDAQLESTEALYDQLLNRNATRQPVAVESVTRENA